MSSDSALSRPRAACALVLGIGVAAGSVVVLTLPRPVALSGPVYSVTALQLQVLHDHRARWMGRTVLVRGLVTGYLSLPPQGVQPPARRSMHLVLLDPGQHRGLLGDLPLVRGPENPVLQRLRLVPLFGPLMPPPQQLDWGGVVVYRVTLRPLPDTSCDLCFMAEFRDAM